MGPYLVLVGCLSAISVSKVFEEVYVMTKGGPNKSSKTVVYYLWEKAFDEFDINYACTIALVLFLAVLGLSILNLYVSQYKNSLVGNNFKRKGARSTRAWEGVD